MSSFQLSDKYHKTGRVLTALKRHLLGQQLCLYLYNLYSVSLTVSHDIAILQNTYTHLTIIYISLSASKFSSLLTYHSCMYHCTDKQPWICKRKNEHIKQNSSSFSSFKEVAQLNQCNYASHLCIKPSPCQMGHRLAEFITFITVKVLVNISLQSKKTAVSIYTTKVSETWKTAWTENRHYFRHRHSDFFTLCPPGLFSSTWQSQCMDFGNIQHQSTANWIVNGV